MDDDRVPWAGLHCGTSPHDLHPIPGVAPDRCTTPTTPAHRSPPPAAMLSLLVTAAAFVGPAARAPTRSGEITMRKPGQIGPDNLQGKFITGSYLKGYTVGSRAPPGAVSSGTTRGSPEDRARPGVNYNVFAENDANQFRCAAVPARQHRRGPQFCAAQFSRRRRPHARSPAHARPRPPAHARARPLSQVPALRRPPGHQGQRRALGGDPGREPVHLRLPGAPHRAVARVRGRAAQRGPPQLRRHPADDPRDRVAAQPLELRAAWLEWIGDGERRKR